MQELSKNIKLTKLILLDELIESLSFNVFTIAMKLQSTTSIQLNYYEETIKQQLVDHNQDFPL